MQWLVNHYLDTDDIYVEAEYVGPPRSGDRSMAQVVCLNSNSILVRLSEHHGLPLVVKVQTYRGTDDLRGRTFRQRVTPLDGLPRTGEMEARVK